MIDAIKSLSPKQRFAALVAIISVSAITSLGTAYMNGSDCGPISDKYNKSIENYAKLVVMTEETQNKYLKARKDIIEIQERLADLEEAMAPKPKRVYLERDTLGLESSKSYLSIERPIPEKAKAMMDSIKKITKRYENR